MAASTGQNEGPVVRLDQVVKEYRMGTVVVPAVAGVSLTLEPARFSVIIGPSGSGKTTLLNLIGCIDGATGGRVEVCGTDVSTLDDDRLSDFRARHIGFIFQNFNLIPVLSAIENVEYPLLLTGMAKAERRRRAVALLEAVGLADQARRRPNEMSGGQRQRVAIARALVGEPDLVLADEPTANLDSRTGAAIIDLMHEMQARARTTFVFSTHDPAVMEHADSIFVIRDGLLVETRERGAAA